MCNLPHLTHHRRFRRRRFLRRRTSSPRPPQPTRHQRNLPADHPGSCGGARSRGLLTRSPFPGELRNRDFAAGGLRASHGSQRLKRTRPRAPVAARKRWLLQLAARQRRRGQRRPKRPSQIFWGGAAAPGSLRLPPGTAGPWKWQKKTHTTINQWAGTCGSPGELWGGMEVAPIDPGRNVVGAGASGCRKLPPPSLLVKKP